MGAGGLSSGEGLGLGDGVVTGGCWRGYVGFSRQWVGQLAGGFFVGLVRRVEDIRWTGCVPGFEGGR